jgi:hypothetical protein
LHTSGFASLCRCIALARTAREKEKEKVIYDCRVVTVGPPLSVIPTSDSHGTRFAQTVRRFFKKKPNIRVNLQPVRLAGGWWWWLVCSEGKVLLAGG